MFGSDVSQMNLFLLILTQLYKTPDNFLRLSLSNSSFESFVSEAYDNSSNISQLKLILKDTFKQLNMSDKGFAAYFSFLWHSSLPCFDIANITAEQNGDTAILKKCYWKGQLIPCSAIFKKVTKYLNDT